MKISQAIMVLQMILAESGDLDMIVLEGGEDGGLDTFEVDLISHIVMDDDEGPVCCIIAPEIVEDLKLDVEALDEKGRPKFAIVKKVPDEKQ